MSAHVCLRACMYAYLCVCTRVCVLVCEGVLVRVYVCVCVHLWSQEFDESQICR